MKCRFIGLVMLLGIVHTLPAQTNDSVVQWEADIANLSLLAPETVPSSGTFWVVTSPVGGNGGLTPPYPCLPTNLNYGDIYRLPDGTMLVDAATNDGDDTVRLASQINAVSNVIQRAETVAQAQSASQMQALDVSGPPFPGGTNNVSTNDVPDTNTYSYTPPDFGTNLFISQWSLSNNVIIGMASNTLADVTYQLQAINNLTQSNGWINVGDPIVGSETTNWTPLNPVAVDFTTNWFYRLQSEQSSDGSGIPDWWETEYGLTGVDPNAFDAAGDGWTIYQKYIMGENPGAWVTPPAPQGLTATYDAGTGTATIRWLPSPGNVTGYVLTTPSGTVNPSASATSYADTDPNLIIGLTPSDYPDEFYGTSFELAANYAGGSSPATTINLQGGHSLGPALPPNIWLVQGAQGSNFLAVAALPPDTAAIRLLREDQPAEAQYGDYSLNVSNDIPLADFTNGLFYVPPGLTTAPVDAYGNQQYVWWAQPVNAGGGANSPGVLLGNNSVSNADYGVSGINPLYLDGRVQMKQDVAFQLRMATEDYPFGYYNDFYESFNYPTNYAFQGFYEPSGLFDSYSDPIQAGTFDPFLPFENNYFYYNFVFNLSQTDQGAPATGVGSYDDLTLAIYQPTNVFQPPDASGTPVPALLGTEAPWLVTAAYPGSTWLYTQFNEIGVSRDGSGNYHLGGANYFGLPFLSVEIAYPSGSSGTATTTLNASGSTQQGGYFYPQTAQPEFQTLAYDFWNASGYYDVNDNWQTWDLLPGEAGFAPTNQTDDGIIASLGGSIQVAAYAKLSLQNGNSGVYGYLGQYFDQAYQMDTNGNVTATPTGVLSPYGNFFPTQPGQVALVTMPDPDTGQRGTGVVNVISLVLDKNHDLKMDTSFSGQDATSASSPDEIWVNNNYDRWKYDSADETNYMDDVQIAGCPYTPNVPTPDCNYRDQYGNRVIPCTRDLEDYFRLWVCGVTPALLTNLPAGSTITLNWGDVGSPNPNNPTIDLFQATDPDGGIGYLTNETAALNQIDPVQSGYVGRVAPGQSVQLNASYFSGWAGNHFIMCGVSNGTGGLNLTIADGSGNVLAQSTTYLQIQDIKQMYERWTVGDQPSRAPLTNAIAASEGLPTGVPYFEYTPPMDPNTPYILFVHGWNMASWEKDRFAESAFKRLYWQGYQGRFGVFRWPTGNQFTGDFSQLLSNPTEKDNYDSSENNASLSGVGLLNKLNNLNAEYPGHVYVLAHSMGNVVTGEALRLAGNNQVVNTYVASQAAVSAHTYDATIPDYSFERSVPAPIVGSINFNFGPNTPDIYGDWFAGNNGGGAGQVISFYNTNDYALNANHWQFDQLLKPDGLVSEGGSLWDYRYSGSANDPAPWNNFFKTNDYTGVRVNFDIVNAVTNRYEVMAYAAQSYSTALGATPGVLNINRNVDLTRSSPTRIWPIDLSENPYGAHFWHSAEFRSDYPSMQGYWSELLSVEAFNLK